MFKDSNFYFFRLRCLDLDPVTPELKEPKAKAPPTTPPAIPGMGVDDAKGAPGPPPAPPKVNPLATGAGEPEKENIQGDWYRMEMVV